MNLLQDKEVDTIDLNKYELEKQNQLLKQNMKKYLSQSKI